MDAVRDDTGLFTAAGGQIIGRFISDVNAKTWPAGWLPASPMVALNVRVGGGFDRGWLPRQVHGRRVAVISTEASDRSSTGLSKTEDPVVRFFGERGDAVQADAVLTDRPACLIGVRTADCLPVWVFDSNGSWTGVVHAGWRGLRHGVVEAAVETACRLWKTPRESVRVRIGPGIRRCCYRVGPEMAADFGMSLQRRPDGRFLDLADALERRLLASGMLAHHIHDEGVCTCCKGLFSYRRQGEEAGRHVSVTGIRVL